MKRIKNILNIKESNLGQLKEELEQLRYKMADPKTLNNKHEQVNMLEKELQVLADLHEVCKEEEGNTLESSLKDLQARYEEQQETINRNTPDHLKETPKKMGYMEQNISILKGIKKTHYDETTEDLADFPSFLDDID